MRREIFTLILLQKIYDLLHKNETDEEDNEYSDLAPIDNIEENSEYLKALHWAINRKKVKNIALAGPYGSGKSSIIETYLKQLDEIRKKSLRVSMATFIENETDEDGNYKKIPLEQDEIEVGILKQLFYKVDYKDIPQSRYRKLHKINWMRIWKNLICAFVVIGIMLFIFSPDLFYEIIHKIEAAGERVGVNEITSLGIFGLFALILLAAIAKTYRLVLFRFKINEVKLPTETVLNSADEANETVFNKNMDEIVYFFEETEYRFIFFEDLDRLENPAIFIHLRELNTLLNNCDGIKGRIVFIYAVRDDIFTDADRTKFFEFIIPVIPVINATNSGEILLQKLDMSKDKGITHEISQEFVLDVAPFIEDMRILQNIYNEFIIYKETIRIEQDLKLSDEEMFALIIFKNLFPKEFADLQMECGVVKQAFSDKAAYIEKQCIELENREKELTLELKKYNTDCFKQLNEIKVAMLCALTNWRGVTQKIDNGYFDNYYANEIMCDNYDMSSLKNLKSVTIHYQVWNESGTYRIENDIQATVKLYCERIDNLRLVQQKGIVAIKKEIEELKSKIHELSSWSLKKLLAEFDIEKVLSNKVMENKLLIFMLRRGYINEKYANYINYFKGTSITKEDMNFILAVKNMEKLPYNYNLTKVGMVIQRLQVYEFEQRSIFNYTLLEKLLSDDTNIEKRNAFLSQLSDEKEDSWNFLDDFMEKTQYRNKLINLLAMNWNAMWNFITENVALTDDRKIFYLKLLIDNVDIERLHDLNNSNKISSFIEEKSDILQKLSDVPNPKLISLIKELEIKFHDITIENISDEILEYIFEHQHYELNSTMIRRIVEFKNDTLISGVDTQNYTTIMTLGYEPLISFVQENLTIYVECLVLAKKNTKEAVEQVLDLLERIMEQAGEDMSSGLQLIEHEEFSLNKISECCGNFDADYAPKVKTLWDELLLRDKVKLSWENIRIYWEKYGLSTNLINYMEVNGDKLVHMENNCLDEVFSKELIQSEIKDSVIEKILHNLEVDVSDIQIENLPDSRLSILIRQKLIPFNKERYTEIENTYPDLCVDFILYNQNEYMKIMDKIPMSKNLFGNLLFSPNLENANMEILLRTFSSGFMTTLIAKQLLTTDIKFTKKLFNIVWPFLLEDDDKNKLLLKSLSVLEASDFEKCFVEISGKYKDFIDRSRRHSIEIADSPDNQKLVERLKEVSYITSYSLKQKKSYDPVTGTNEIKTVISCFIKAIKE